MSELIDAVIKTRKISAEIAVKSLIGINSISEFKLHKLIIAKMSNCPDIFPEGWYAPPEGGVSVLFDKTPFKRLLYGSLRDPEYAPDTEHKFTIESVGNIYLSPVNKKTKTLADIGFTVYRGENEKIKQHLKKSYDIVRKIAEHAQIGMKFSELCKFASELFINNNLKPTKRIIISSDQKQNLNLGHSIPGSSENNLITENSFQEIKEHIRTKRVSVVDTEDFIIPSTYAFTVESRLEDLNNPQMPSASWHFVVCFNEGEKTILDNFGEIFKTVGMNYMNTKQL
ncbi:hypothetical protein K8Q98_01960 [Candidatus Nomurabacteria bacterium]|nr:hypothetical protein [Candidatus Nomurabacteria bacterium]